MNKSRVPLDIEHDNIMQSLTCTPGANYQGAEEADCRPGEVQGRQVATGEEGQGDQGWHQGG